MSPPPLPAPVPQEVRTAFHAMAKAIGPLCNLQCAYCYYLEKEKLFPANERFAMSDEVLEEYVRQYIAGQPDEAPEVCFAWQGGEPTLLGIDFFRRALAFQRKHAGGKPVANALQTNGTLLDDRWCAFLAENRFLVGLSLDGPEPLHDGYRVDKGGKPTFARALRGCGLLLKHGVEFNTLTVVHRENAKRPQEVYRFLKEIGSRHLQFIPLVERPPNGGPGVTRRSVPAPRFGEFLCAIFDEWVRRDVGSVFVQLFEVALGNWLGLGSSLCTFAERCGDAVVVEHNGDVYSCDHFVQSRYRLGNLLQRDLGAMVRSPEQRAFGNAKLDRLPEMCLRCDVRFACHGECPKNRFLRTPQGEPGLNYLCAGYKRFFHHIDTPMRILGALLQAGRPPSEIMTMLPA